MKKVKVRVREAEADFVLSEDAPSTATAFWESLPIEGEITHGRWAGSAVWVKTANAPLSGTSENELPVTSIYPGTIVVRPNPRGVAEVFMSYGVAESRGPLGRTYATPVADVVGNPDALFAAFAGTWQGGSAPVAITRVEESA